MPHGLSDVPQAEWISEGPKEMEALRYAKMLADLQAHGIPGVTALLEILRASPTVGGGSVSAPVVGGGISTPSALAASAEALAEAITAKVVTQPEVLAQALPQLGSFRPEDSPPIVGPNERLPWGGAGGGGDGYTRAGGEGDAAVTLNIDTIRSREDLIALIEEITASLDAQKWRYNR